MVAIQQQLIRVYSDVKYVHTAMVRHQGTTIALAMDESRRIHYSVLDFSDANKGEIDANHWSENPAELRFPTEATEVGFGVAPNALMPTVKSGGRHEDASGQLLAEEVDPFLSSTARLTALAPFGVVSDGAMVYVFRQSIDASHRDAVFLLRDGRCTGDSSLSNVVEDAAGKPAAIVHDTLLCDRFVLVGRDLKPVIESRFRRSRQRTVPNSVKDSLGVQDMEGRYFYEPTQILSFVRHLREGRFAILLAPTQQPDTQRWQIFAANQRTGRIDSFNIERRTDGLFNTEGTRHYTSPDAAFQDAVFERNPGFCPFTGRPLIPIISKDDFAETALLFDGQRGHVDLGNPAALRIEGGSFTIEAWVKPAGDGVLISRWDNKGEKGFQLRIHGGRLVAKSSSHEVFGETQFDFAESAGYYHVAAAWDATAGSCAVYVNAAEDGKGALAIASGNGPLLIGGIHENGGVTDLFGGVVDDVRIWDRALEHAELERNRHTRLIGSEPGLIAYYRFDEGRGRTIHDQTDNAAHGNLAEGPRWVKSEAPVGAHPGIHRDSFTIEDRTLETGLSAVLYYVQSDGPSGYGDMPKPVKRQARVLLAAGTRNRIAEGRQTDKTLLATIDLAVARDGRLAQIPDVLRLPLLGQLEPNVSIDRVEAAQEQIGASESRMESIKQRLAEIPARLVPSEMSSDEIRSLTSERDRVIYEGRLNPYMYKAEVDLLDAKISQAKQRRADELTGERARLIDELTTLQLNFEAKRAELATLTSGMQGDELSFPSPVLHTDALGLTITGGLLAFGYTADKPLLFDSATGKVTLYFRGQNGQFFAAYYDTRSNTGTMKLPLDGGHWLTLSGRMPGVDLENTKVVIEDGSLPDLCTLVITHGDVVERFVDVPRASGQLSCVLNGMLPPPQPVGNLDACSDNPSELTLAAASPSPLVAGALLRVGGAVTRTAADVPAGSLKIPLATAVDGLAPGMPVESLLYDVRMASSNHPASRLERGSRIVIAVPGMLNSAGSSEPESAKVLNGAAQSNRLALACAWRSDAPGRAYQLNGRSQCLTDRALAPPVQPKLASSPHAESNSTVASLAGTTSSYLIARPFKRFPSSQWTIECWIKPDATCPTGGVVSYATPSSDNAVLLFDHRNLAIWVFKARVITGVSFPDGRWSHLAVTWDSATGAAHVYRNGQPVWNGTLSQGAQLDDGGALVLGQEQDTVGGGFDANQTFRGEISEFRIWRCVRTEEEIRALLHRRLRGSEPQLACYWPLDERAGDVAHDQSGGDNTGSAKGVNRVDTIVPLEMSAAEGPAAADDTFHAAVNIETPGDLTVETWVRYGGKRGRSRIVHGNKDQTQFTLGLLGDAPQTAALFTKANQFVDCGEVDLSNCDFTIEFWFQSSASTGSVTLVRHGEGPRALQLQVAGQRIQGAQWLAGLNSAESVHASAGCHVALVYRKQDNLRILYLDGQEVHRHTVDDASYLGTGRLQIGGGHGAAASDHRSISIDEVRVWRKARSRDEIANDMGRRLTNPQAYLSGCWSFPGGKVIDQTGSYPEGSFNGETAYAPSPLNIASLFAGVGDRFVRVDNCVPGQQWQHISVAFEQSWGLRFDGQSYLDAGDGSGTNITGDLTIEVFVQLESLGMVHGLIGKGRFRDGTSQGVPYQLTVSADGAVVFSYENGESGRRVTLRSAERLRAGEHYRLAVTRKGGTTKHERQQKKSFDAGKESIEFDVIESVEMEDWSDVRIFINGRPSGDLRDNGGAPKGHDGPVEIGRVWPAENATGLSGVVSEVRLWDQARESGQLGKPIRPTDRGLVALWRLEENRGNVATDATGRHPARLRGASWVKDPDPAGSRFRVYLNGVAAATEPVPASDALYQDGYGAEQLTLGARRVDALGFDDWFEGTIEEVRVWRTARTEEQTLDNLFTRIKSDKRDLVAYYSFDYSDTEAGVEKVRDDGLRGNDLRLQADPEETPRVVLSTAPISNDAAQVRSAMAGIRTAFHETIDSAPAVSEYADMQRGLEGELSGVMKRCYGYIRDGGWRLVTGYKVGELVSEWVGQAQFDPQLVGYVEGGPPVPSENLTAGLFNPSFVTFDDVAVTEFVQADEVVYSQSSSQESSRQAAVSGSLKASAKGSTMILTAPMGFGVATEIEAGVEIEAKVGFETSNSWSSECASAHGKTVQRSMTVATNGNWEDPEHLLNPFLGRRWIPVNQGFALVQSETADVYAMRLAHNNALVAYRMLPNPDIPKDWNIISFPLNPRYTKAGCLDGIVGFTETGPWLDPDYANASGHGERSYFKPTEAYALKRRIQREEERSRRQFVASGAQSHADGNAARQAAQLASGVLGVDLPRPPAPAERIALSPAKRRNLVNTYVWSADGGFFAESTQTLDMVSESASGSFSISGSAGLSLGVEVSAGGLGAGVGLEASSSASLSHSRAASAQASRSFGIDTSVGVTGNLQRYDENLVPQFDSQGNAICVPGKVDAYRFMTFYLDSDRENFEDFYNKVIDPIWLAESDHPSAAALRATRQSDKKPPCWRILHRVTFVSRLLPAEADPSRFPLEAAMREQDIISSYELVRQIEPYVRNSASTLGELSAATRRVLAARLPRLIPHADQIIGFLANYFGVTDEDR